MSLSGVNVAITTGKAMDLLSQRLITRYGISDIRVESGGKEYVKPVMNIQIRSDGPFTEHSRRLVEYEIHKVNERYRTNIHAKYSLRKQDKK